MQARRAVQLCVLRHGHGTGAIVHVQENRIKASPGLPDHVAHIVVLDHNTRILKGVTGQATQKLLIPHNHLVHQFGDRDPGCLGQQVQRFSQRIPHAQAADQHVRLLAPLHVMAAQVGQLQFGFLLTTGHERVFGQADVVVAVML